MQYTIQHFITPLKSFGERMSKRWWKSHKFTLWQAVETPSKINYNTVTPAWKTFNSSLQRSPLPTTSSSLKSVGCIMATIHHRKLRLGSNMVETMAAVVALCQPHSITKSPTNHLRRAKEKSHWRPTRQRKEEWRCATFPANE